MFLWPLSTPMTTIVVVLLAIGFISAEDGLPLGPNVCTMKVVKQRNVTRPVKVPYEVKTFTFCITFRCERTRTEYAIAYKMIEEDYETDENVCCDGYQPTRNGRSCVPSCERLCQHGQCDSNTHACLCSAGYTGKYCEQTCPSYLWGPNCSQRCDCPKRATCHSVSGKCFCPEDTDAEMDPNCIPRSKTISYVIDERETKNAGIAGIVISVLVVVCLMAVSIVIYYRRTVKVLKKQLEHKHQPQQSLQVVDSQVSFDNPMYDHAPGICAHVTIPMNAQTEELVTLSEQTTKQFGNFHGMTRSCISASVALHGKIMPGDQMYQSGNDLDYLSNVYQNPDEAEMVKEEPVYSEPGPKMHGLGVNGKEYCFNPPRIPDTAPPAPNLATLPTLASRVGSTAPEVVTVLLPSPPDSATEAA